MTTSKKDSSPPSRSKKTLDRILSRAGVASRTEAKAWIAARRVRVNVFEIVLSEGRNREVRRMVEALGSKVLKLVRTRIGPIRIGDLPIGSCRPLSPAEIRSLQKSGKGSSLGRDKRST
jgi:pseudouridine synthase